MSKAKRMLIRKFWDRVAAAPLRFFMRNCIVNPWIRMNYAVTLDVEPAVYTVTNGALVIANHVSLVDGPLILNAAWPFARLRPTAAYKEMTNPVQLWPMRIFGTTALGAPAGSTAEVRKMRAERAHEILDKLVDTGWGVLIFPEGKIGDGIQVRIRPENRAVYELLHENPSVPVISVRIAGLERSRCGGNVFPRIQLWQRLPVHLTVRLFRNVDTAAGVTDLNARMEKHFNTGENL
jgi:1-acyl-sn-glycerol-3-phosphate acyltransferase